MLLIGEIYPLSIFDTDSGMGLAAVPKVSVTGDGITRCVEGIELESIARLAGQESDIFNIEAFATDIEGLLPLGVGKQKLVKTGDRTIVQKRCRRPDAV